MNPSSTPRDHLGRTTSSKGPLSHNDVHYLVGFLYAIVNRNQGSVVLGDRIADVASESKRDVDIVVVSNEDACSSPRRTCPISNDRTGGPSPASARWQSSRVWS